MNPTKYRKKPVVVEAMRWDGTLGSAADIQTWSEGQTVYALDLDYLAIATLEGTMRAVKGDWIIKGVQGEFYPCKPDIFAMTYEPIV